MKLRAALAQINPTVGDLAGNAALIADSVKRAQDHGANLIVFPEMIVTGYPVEDLAKCGYLGRSDWSCHLRLVFLPTW